MPQNEQKGIVIAENAASLDEFKAITEALFGQSLTTQTLEAADDFWKNCLRLAH